jgi:hypothetical protein
MLVTSCGTPNAGSTTKSIDTKTIRARRAHTMSTLQHQPSPIEVDDHEGLLKAAQAVLSRSVELCESLCDLPEGESHAASVVEHLRVQRLVLERHVVEFTRGDPRMDATALRRALARMIDAERDAQQEVILTDIGVGD